MIILRKLFSSKSEKTNKDKDKEDRKNLYKSAAGLGGSVLALSNKENALGAVGDKILKTRNKSQNAKKVRKTLLKEAKKSGVKIESASGLGNSVYLKDSKLHRKLSDSFGKLLKKAGQNFNSLGPNGKVVENLGKNKVLLDNHAGSLRDVDVLAHELGHAHYSGKKAKGIGKIAHKTMTTSKIVDKATPVVGFISGIKSAKKKAEGKEDSVVNKNISWALPAATQANILTAEAAATRKGLKNLKRLGANRSVQKIAKKKLGLALGTYGVGAAASLAGSLGAREAGKLVGRAVYGKKDSKKDKNKKKED